MFGAKQNDRLIITRGLIYFHWPGFSCWNIYINVSEIHIILLYLLHSPGINKYEKQNNLFEWCCMWNQTDATIGHILFGVLELSEKWQQVAKRRD